MYSIRLSSTVASERREIPDNRRESLIRWHTEPGVLLTKTLTLTQFFTPAPEAHLTGDMTPCSPPNPIKKAT